MSFFSNCKSLDELKEKYRRLAKENHPDTGGQSSVFKRIQTEYENKRSQFETNEKYNTFDNMQSERNEDYFGRNTRFYRFNQTTNESKDPIYQALTDRIQTLESKIVDIEIELKSSRNTVIDLLYRNDMITHQLDKVMFFFATQGIDLDDVTSLHPPDITFKSLFTRIKEWFYRPTSTEAS